MLVPDGSESTLRQPISSVGHRHREDRPDTWSPSVPRQSLVVFTMPPHTTPLLILTHGDAVDPIPSAVQHGTAGPHDRHVVLRPGYPRRLLDKKLYLAGGVAAVFEVKNTLTAAHITKTWRNVRAVNELQEITRDRALHIRFGAHLVRPTNSEGTALRSPLVELVPRIFYGLLAHGHSWDKPRSDPLLVITRKLQGLVNETPHMRDFLSLLCVANLASWQIHRTTYLGPALDPPYFWENHRKHLGDEPVCSAHYRMTSSSVAEDETTNPLGQLVHTLVGRLAYSDATLRPLAQYLSSGMSGPAGGPIITRFYPWASQLSEDVRDRMPQSLTNGEPGSEWEMAFAF